MGDGGRTLRERVRVLLERYVEEHVLHGVAPDPEELCRDQPELLQPVQEQIRRYEDLNRLLDPPTKLKVGESLLHYRIVERLGAGGMGEVYLAEDGKLGRRVALKVLAPEMAVDREHLAGSRARARGSRLLSALRRTPDCPPGPVGLGLCAPAPGHQHRQGPPAQRNIMSHRSKMLALGLATLIVLPGAALYATDADGVPTPQGPGPSTIKVEGSGSLTTLFAANNGFAGNTFDLENIGTEAITWDKP